jgi:hypothetical protein
MKRIAIAIAVAIAAGLGALLVGVQPAGAAIEGYTWQHVGGRWAVVYVQNDTNGHWAVNDAVRAWGSGLRIGSCRRGAGCIRVTSPARGNKNPLGQSFIYASGTSITRVDIQLNASDEAQPATVRKVAAEHELGHALGLAHDTSYHGIMGPTAWSYDHINQFERNELARMYGF